ncbi:MAG: hypothetical protein JW915_18755 [Chitinispirillaceae bacterium]|nr:hypothetical protein [Chitinispirillaceae bacterium]
MFRLNDNQHGFALVYGLVVLLLASVGGTALLFMAQKDRIGASDYSQMRSASLAAMTAVKAFEGQMLKYPDKSVSLLIDYLADPDRKFLFGSTASSTEKRIKLWGDATIEGVRSPEYSAKIIGFDQSNYFITIEGKGYGSNGGLKKVIASYNLAGLGLSDRSIGSTHGLFLGGALQNCNGSIRVKGDVYLSLNGGGSSQHFNSGGVIEGNLKTAAVSAVMDFTSAGALYVKGNALMQSRLQPQGLFKVSGDAGFTYKNNDLFMNFTKAMEINGNVYCIQTFNFGFANCIDGDSKASKTAYYNTSSTTADRFKDYAYKKQIPTSTADYVAAQLGMIKDNESALGLNLPGSWGAGVTKDLPKGTKITGANLETWWNEKMVAEKLFQNEWLVINLNGDVSMNGGTFTKKVIWITNGKSISVNKLWYNCDLASNTLLIVNEKSALYNMGVPNGSNFRGLIYHSKDNSTANTSYSFGGSSILYGAIQHAGTAQFNLNGTPSDSLRIWFNDPIGQAAIQEIVNTGVILSPGLTTPAQRGLALSDMKIRPKLVTLQL